MTYTEIRCENRDILLILTIDKWDRLHFLCNYNSIGNTYYGWSIDCFLGTLTRFVRHFPELFEELEDHARLPELLDKYGFVKREPTDLENRMYG